MKPLSYMAVAMFLGTILVAGCSENDTNADAITGPDVEEFQSFIEGGSYFSSPWRVIGGIWWRFDPGGVVLTSMVSARVGNAFLISTSMGTYSVEKHDGVLQMTCHYSRKLLWWTDEDGFSVDLVWDEEYSAPVELQDDGLLIDGVLYRRTAV